MKIKKTVFQLFVILLAVTMLSTFSMAKPDKKHDKNLEKQVNSLKKQVKALSKELDALQGEVGELSTGNQGGNDTGPRFMCPGCIFPGGKLPGDVLDRLPGAYLPGAWFFSTDLTGVDLSGADLSGAMWGNTTCPDGTNSSEDDGDGYTCLNNLIP